MHWNGGDPSYEERLYECILALLSKWKFNIFLTELKYDVLSRNSLILFKKSVPEVLPHFSEFATLGLEELHIFSISAVDRNKEKKMV